MRSKSIDPALIHHNDTVCILHTGDTLGDDQLGCIRDLFSECSADFRICSCIYRTGTVIQDQDLRLFQNCPGNTESLLLSTRYIISTLFDVRLIFLWKSFNKFICTCQFTRFYALFICGIFISPPQIFQNRAGEKNILLKYNCYLGSQRLHVIFSDISATDKNFSLCHIIQTTDQIDQTGLCTSCSPDDPDCLS